MASENPNTDPQTTDPAGIVRTFWDQPGLSDAERIEARWNGTQWYTTGEDVGPWARAQSAMISAAAGRISYSDFDRIMLVEKCRDAELRAIHAERPKGPGIHSSSHDASPQILEAAFARTAGLGNLEKHYTPEVLEASDQYKSLSLGRLLLLTAQASGGYTGRPWLDRGNLKEVLQAAWSDGTMSALLTNVSNKFLLDGFTSIEQTWRAVCRVKPCRDFKQNTSYRMTADAVLVELPPGGTIKQGTIGSESFTVQARTYARMLTLERTDIVNDDLGAFDDLRTRLGRGGALALNAKFWAIFLDNAAHFTLARANLLQGAGSALADDAVALAAAEQAFLDLSDAQGHPLGVTPALLLVPTSLGTGARRLYTAQEMRDTTADTTYLTTNLFANRFKPLVSSYLGSKNTNGSDTAWYLLSDPANLAVMEVTFLDGVEAPTVEVADVDFDKLGISTRGYFDFGCSLAEWRAGVRNDGV